jgi:hypothetical protein
MEGGGVTSAFLGKRRVMCLRFLLVVLLIPMGPGIAMWLGFCMPSWLGGSGGNALGPGRWLGRTLFVPLGRIRRLFLLLSWGFEAGLPGVGWASGLSWYQRGVGLTWGPLARNATDLRLGWFGVVLGAVDGAGFGGV